MKHLLTLCLMACIGTTSLQAQIELPTRRRSNTQQQTATQQQTTQQAPPQRDTVHQHRQPANGGMVALPTTRRNTEAQPEPQPTANADSTGVVGGRPLPVVRRQQAPRARPIVERPKVEDNQIYESAEKMPTYPGGAAELVKFINEHLEYPQQALADSAQGIVQVSFIVEKNGTPTEFEVLDEHHPALEAEAVRVLQLMPKWKPATQNGVKVRVEYVVPVKFTLPKQ